MTALTVYALAALTVCLLVWLIAADTSTNPVGPILAGILLGAVWPLIVPGALVIVFVSTVVDTLASKRAARRKP